MPELKEAITEYTIELPVTRHARRAAQPLPRLRLPAGFAWLKHLDGEEQVEFFGDLLKAVLTAQQSGYWAPVTELIEEWKATANVRADPLVMEALERARQERAQGEVVSLSALRQELGL